MILGALLGCGADEWRVKSAVEGLCGAPLRVESLPGEGNGNGQPTRLAMISERDAKVWPGFLTREEAWFMADSRRMGDDLIWYDRRKPDFGMDNEFDTEVAKYKTIGRWSFGWLSPWFLYGHVFV
jgi:hypothetical protein